MSFSDQGSREVDNESKATVVCPFGVCVCGRVRSDFASKAARREHQTNFEELEGLIAMVSCLHETVRPAAHVGLLGISLCWQAPKEKDDVEEADALSGSPFLMVRASQFCVAPAGQSKLRSGGLREGSLTLACLRMCPLPQGSQKLMQAAAAQTADPIEDAKQAVPPRALLLACLACCGLRLSGLLEVHNCRLWPLPSRSSCRRRFRRKKRSRRCSGSRQLFV